MEPVIPKQAAPVGEASSRARAAPTRTSLVGGLVRENASFMFVALAFIATALALDAIGLIARPTRLIWFDRLPIQLGIAWATASVLANAYTKARDPNVSLYQPAAWQASMSEELRLDRIVGYLLFALLFIPFMSAYAKLKRSIPFWLGGFQWDGRLAEADRLLHGGTHPWELIQPLVGTPIFTALIDSAYYLWFPILILTVTGFAWLPGSRLRIRFFTTFFLTWSVLGIGLATLLSSAGPCYFSQVVAGSDPYAPLMQYLNNVSASHDLTALYVQDYLWTGYTTGSYPIEGISAMPSLHVAMATLMWCAMRPVHRLAGLAYLVFLACILLGSVHLGWHYALDGYVSILLVCVLWWLSGRLDTSWVADRGPDRIDASSLEG